MPIIGGKLVHGHGIDLPIVYLGIDPGTNGGIASITPRSVVACRMPSSKHGLRSLLALLAKDGNAVAYMEKVGGYMPGSAGNIGSAMFEFGKSVGQLEMALEYQGIKYNEVTASSWQRVMGVIPRSAQESKQEHKRKLKAKAEELFPEVSVTLATADALLLAEYCRRHWR